MGKKNNSLRMAQHQNAKTAMVSAVQDERLKPYILQVVGQASQQMAQNLARQQLGAIGEVMSSIATLKEVLISKGVATEQEFVETRFNVEDKAWGLTASDDGAATGDFVRITYKAKGVADAEYGTEQRENVRRLGTDEIQPEIRDGILGMKTGETKEIAFKVTNKMLDEATKQLIDQESHYLCQVSVDRVSKYPAAKEPEAAPKVEAPAQEAAPTPEQVLATSEETPSNDQG